MSRGLSRLQRGILSLLRGERRALVYSAGGALVTPELVEEMVEAGLLPDTIAQEQATFTVRRACYSLVRRGLLKGERSARDETPWIKTIAWSAVRAP